jgi:hypothetical protein
MARPLVQVEGVRELRASMRRLGQDVNQFKDVHAKVGNYVGATAASGAPRRTGMLAASWRPGSAATQATIRFGGAGVPYAHAVHWGTGARAGKRGPHNIRPSLFAVNAAHATEPTWVPWYQAALQSMVNKVRGA